MKEFHKGAPRRYWCQKGLDEQGKVRNITGCDNAMLRDGEKIPLCPGHGLPMRKARFKRVEERRWETIERSKLVIGGTHYWSDDAVRKAKCHLCFGQIEKGERRIAIDSPTRMQGITTISGGVITRVRSYVHASCFIDMIFGGQAGEGCPGCSAKILHDEFMEVKGLLEREYGNG